LFCYAGWFLVTWIAMLIVRHRVADTTTTTVIGLVCFEAVGVAGYIIGTAQGMHKWDFMFAMMIIGGLFFLVRAENLSSGSGGAGCGGGCGGGGCGGGGCGGCGG